MLIVSDVELYQNLCSEVSDSKECSLKKGNKSEV
jgi:hypothetical protein